MLPFKKNIMKYIRFSLALLVLSLMQMSSAQAKTIKSFTKGMVAQKGFFTLYTDVDQGRLYLRIDKIGQKFIYHAGLRTGLGSNNIGLDRLQIGRSKLAQFDRTGRKILLRHLNYKFRAENGNDFEKRAVDESFADAVVWGFKIVATENKSVLIEMTDFLLSDQYGIVDRMQWTGQGSFQLDKTRSVLYQPRTKSFPKNTEIETMLTFRGKNAGSYFREVAANAKSFTVYQHFSFVELPSAGFEIRKYNIHSSFSPLSYMDFSVDLITNQQKQIMPRHRLKKKNPEAKISEAVKPIIYYLDQAIPAPVRGAIKEGALFWNKAFEAAGYINAFQVHDLRADMDPMDIRYNVINWVHRKTRGYSTGGYIHDPRTGEIIKANVTIGSLRVRQNMLMANGLMMPFDGSQDKIKQAIDFALARQRQLAAHEVGHSLGLAHNSVSSTSPYGRASVMDDPYPLVTVTPKGGLDFSKAYSPTIGEWDKVSVRYGYSDFAKGKDRKKELELILEEARKKDLRFFSHHHGRFNRSLFNGHLKSNIWDVGSDPVKSLADMLKVREIALQNFSAQAIPLGERLSSLEETLVPLYYFHRYQLEAAAKYIGGRDYEYALRRRDGQQINRAATKSEQLKALNVILKSLEPKNLKIPEHILELIPPKALGNEPNRESFPRKSSLYLGLDPLAIGESLTHHIFTLLLSPARMARVHENGLRDKTQLSLKNYLDKISATVFLKTKANGLDQALYHRVQYVYLQHLMSDAEEASAPVNVRAILHNHLQILHKKLKNKKVKNKSDQAHMNYLKHLLDQYVSGKYKADLKQLSKMPPGSPI